MADYYAKTNDTKIDFRAQLLDGDDNPVPLTGCTVRFHISNPKTGASLVDGAVEILDADEAQVKYAGDSWATPVMGLLWVEWQVTFSDSKVLSFPSDGHQTLLVTQDLA